MTMLAKINEERKEAFKEGQDQLAALIQRLIADGRADVIERVAEDPEYRQKQMTEYRLF